MRKAILIPPSAPCFLGSSSMGDPRTAGPALGGTHSRQLKLWVQKQQRCNSPCSAVERRSTSEPRQPSADTHLSADTATAACAGAAGPRGWGCASMPGAENFAKCPHLLLVCFFDARHALIPNTAAVACAPTPTHCPPHACLPPPTQPTGRAHKSCPQNKTKLNHLPPLTAACLTSSAPNPRDTLL